MKIYSDPTLDGRSQKPRPGAYEWWYFDGMCDDGVHSFVIIFYEGNPFSKHYMRAAPLGGLASDHPALSVSVYSGSRPVYYAFTEFDPRHVSWSERNGLIACDMAGQTFRQERRGDGWGYRIRMDQILDSGYQFNADLDIDSRGVTRRLLQGADPSEASPDSMARDARGGMDHAWNLVLARARVSGGMTVGRPGSPPLKIDAAGDGYHDHNVGWEPMKVAFSDWYWGRFHGHEGEMVYYVMRGSDGVIRPAAWLNLDGVLYASSEAAMEKRTVSRFGLIRSEILRFTFDHGMQTIVHSQRCVDDGPFYQRFISRLDVQRPFDPGFGWRGITEYIRPERIQNRLFWPLVDMRIRYARHSPHWVQRIPELYSATW